MSVSRCAVLIVGLERKEFPDQEKLETLLDDEDLQSVSEYDDSENAICGVIVKTYGLHCRDLLNSAIESAERQFFNFTGMKSKIFVTMNEY